MCCDTARYGSTSGVSAERCERRWSALCCSLTSLMGCFSASCSSLAASGPSDFTSRCLLEGCVPAMAAEAAAMPGRLALLLLLPFPVLLVVQAGAAASEHCCVCILYADMYLYVCIYTFQQLYEKVILHGIQELHSASANACQKS